MKRNDILIITSTLAYSFLFYEQSHGFNYLLFGILLIVLLLWRDFSLVSSKQFIAVAVGCIVSSFCIFWYDTSLPYTACIISLMLLAGISMKRNSSFIIAFFHSAYSFTGVMFFLFIDVMKRLTSATTEGNQNNWLNKMVLAIFPVLIFLVFFFIYRAGNPIFDELASKINFDFISIYWCIFSVGGFLLMYAFFKHRVINSLIARDELTPDNLFPLTKENFANSATGKLITIPGLVYTGVLLLILLNVLLAAVNSVDIYYLGIAHRIPAGITFSQYLHNGTNSLIASIILAIAIILFYFRGYLNFYENNRLLKSLSFVWIIQNIILVISTAYRNTAYISNYGLTHKRIGVYVYLILCVVGLITTFIKISHKKNNWFLFRKNAWIFYGFMIIACPFDWDSIITTFDINRFQKDNTMEIDQRYLAQLSHTNLAQIFEYYIVEGKTLHANSNERQISRVETYNYYGEQIKNMIWYQYLDLKHDYAAHKWQSHCVTKSQNLKGVEKMIEEHHLVCPVSVR